MLKVTLYFSDVTDALDIITGDIRDEVETVYAMKHPGHTPNDIDLLRLAMQIQQKKNYAYRYNHFQITELD